MRLPKKRRMTRSREFQRVREEGEAYRGRLLVLGVKADPALSSIRVGFITTKRLGGAVIRNQMRRRMRALIHESGDQIAPGHFLVLIARQGAVEASPEALRKEWKWLLHRAKLLSNAGVKP